MPLLHKMLIALSVLAVGLLGLAWSGLASAQTPTPPRAPVVLPLDGSQDRTTVPSRRQDQGATDQRDDRGEARDDRRDRREDSRDDRDDRDDRLSDDDVVPAPVVDRDDDDDDDEEDGDDDRDDDGDGDGDDDDGDDD